MVPVQTSVNHVGTPPNEPHMITVTSVDDALLDDYTTTLRFDFNYWPETKIVTVRNMDEANGLRYSVYGAISETPEDGDWLTMVGEGGELAEQVVGPGENTYQMTGLEWRHLKVECKNDKAGDTAQVKVEIRCVLRA